MAFEFSNEIDRFVEQSKVYLGPWLITLGGIWAFNILNWMIGSRLNILGIYPRHPFGLIGIIFAPFLHRDFNHLFFNTIPLFVLSLALLTKGPMTFYWVTLVVVLLGGFGVWLFGRKAIHLGASGVISGYFGYILVTAYTQPSYTTIFLAVFIFYYFGTIFLGLIPKEERVSWESHVFGFLSGVLCAFLPNGILFFR